MDQIGLLRLAADTLDRLGIRYALVGSYASSAWGEPRMTHDIDIVIEADVFDVRRLCEAFSTDEFYISKSAAEEAVQRKSQFNLLCPTSGDKIDFMIAGTSDWARTQLDRSVRAPLLPDREVLVASPEDVILGKLIYYKDGGSEKHVRDITGILTAGAVDIDRDYLAHHAKELGVEEEWRSILEKLNLS